MWFQAREPPAVKLQVPPRCDLQSPECRPELGEALMAASDARRQGAACGFQAADLHLSDILHLQLTMRPPANNGGEQITSSTRRSDMLGGRDGQLSCGVAWAVAITVRPAEPSATMWHLPFLRPAQLSAQSFSDF
jgi:hypothetical protein